MDEKLDKILQQLDVIEKRLTSLEIKGDKMMTLARGLADKL